VGTMQQMISASLRILLGHLVYPDLGSGQYQPLGSRMPLKCPSSLSGSCLSVPSSVAADHTAEELL
jgi:hypothetical protein